MHIHLHTDIHAFMKLPNVIINTNTREVFLLIISLFHFLKHESSKSLRLLSVPWTCLCQQDVSLPGVFSESGLELHYPACIFTSSFLISTLRWLFSKPSSLLFFFILYSKSECMELYLYIPCESFSSIQHEQSTEEAAQPLLPFLAYSTDTDK